VEVDMNTTSTRGTHRSDAEVFADARKRLDDCPTIPGTVRVHVDERHVTLTGNVQHPSERIEAEQAVRPAIGDRRLENHITVTPLRSPQGFEAPEP
jgi:osmotically-inducible protein OsmY